MIGREQFNGSVPCYWNFRRANNLSLRADEAVLPSTVRHDESGQQPHMLRQRGAVPSNLLFGVVNGPGLCEI